jgi:hypothetical protein
MATPVATVATLSESDLGIAHTWLEERLSLPNLLYARRIECDSPSKRNLNDGSPCWSPPRGPGLLAGGRRDFLAPGWPAAHTAALKPGVANLSWTL